MSMLTFLRGFFSRMKFLLFLVDKRAGFPRKTYKDTEFSPKKQGWRDFTPHSSVRDY